MDDDSAACITIRRRTGDMIEPFTYARFLDAAHRTFLSG